MSRRTGRGTRREPAGVSARVWVTRGLHRSRARTTRWAMRVSPGRVRCCTRAGGRQRAALLLASGNGAITVCNEAVSARVIRHQRRAASSSQPAGSQSGMPDRGGCASLEHLVSQPVRPYTLGETTRSSSADMRAQQDLVVIGTGAGKSGANPALPRSGERGRTLHLVARIRKATGGTPAGKAQRVGRSASPKTDPSQESGSAPRGWVRAGATCGAARPAVPG